MNANINDTFTQILMSFRNKKLIIRKKALEEQSSGYLSASFSKNSEIRLSTFICKKKKSEPDLLFGREERNGGIIVLKGLLSQIDLLALKET